MDFLWQTQGVQTEVFGTRAGDTTTLKITTQAMIGQIPTICRDMSTKVIWYKSSVWRQSPEHPNIICHGLKENTASSKKKIAPQVSSESPFFNENIKKFWTFLIVLWWTWRSSFAHEPYKLCNMLLFHFIFAFYFHFIQASSFTNASYGFAPTTYWSRKTETMKMIPFL